MSFFVWYSLGQYDGEELIAFTTERSLIEFLNTHANNQHFTFRVVEGVERKFRPLKVATQYEMLPSDPYDRKTA